MKGVSKYIENLVFGSYLKAVNQIHEPDRHTRDLSYFQELLDALKIDVKRWPSVTVTGSKGKGSTAVMLASILGASGERVGLVTSPHMRFFTERIRIDGRCVAIEELEKTAREIAPVVNKIIRHIPLPYYLGPGAVIIALAFKIFEKNKVSAIVIEAGRGGEFDEARLLSADVSVLTPIMLEHTDKLGCTIEEIAETKIRITRPGSVIVSSKQTADVRKAMRKAAGELGSEFREVGNDIFIKNINDKDNRLNFDISTNEYLFRNLHVNFAESYQAENAATAILAAQEMTKYGVKCTQACIYEGLKKVRWPGRGQVLQKKPWVFLDGAINEESAKIACEVVNKNKFKKIKAIIAVPKSKDIKGVFKEVSKITQSVICTEVINSELRWYENVEEIAADYFDFVEKITAVQEAIDYALSQTEIDECILMLGTQSFLREVLEYWKADTCRIW